MQGHLVAGRQAATAAGGLAMRLHGMQRASAEPGHLSTALCDRGAAQLRAGAAVQAAGIVLGRPAAAARREVRSIGVIKDAREPASAMGSPDAAEAAKADLKRV